MKIKILTIATWLVSTLQLSGAWAEDMHHDGEREHLNHVAVFLGNIHAEGHDEFTIGVDYERRLAAHWGFGGLIEYAGGDLDATLLAVPLFFHPDRYWRLMLAPGIVFHSGDTEFLVRAGVAYEFEINERWTLSPEFSVDLVDGEYIQVFGISIGHNF